MRAPVLIATVVSSLAVGFLMGRMTAEDTLKPSPSEARSAFEEPGEQANPQQVGEMDPEDGDTPPISAAAREGAPVAASGSNELPPLESSNDGVKMEIQLPNGQKISLPNNDDRLQAWIRARPAKGEPISRTKQPDGREIVRQKIDERAEATQIYDRSGRIVSEEVSEDSGLKVSRMFFANGQTKYVGFIAPAGSKDLTLIDSGGFPTNRTLEIPGGDKIVFEYDESGNITRKLYLQKGQPNARVIQ